MEKQQPEEMYAYVDEPPDDLFCPIMSTLLLEPHLTECCGKNLSKKAVDQLKGKGCPLCRTDPFKTIRNIPVRNQVRELPVFCRHRKRGCGWLGELSAFESHIESCPKRENLLAEQQRLGNIVYSDNWETAGL